MLGMPSKSLIIMCNEKKLNIILAEDSRQGAITFKGKVNL